VPNSIFIFESAYRAYLGTISTPFLAYSMPGIVILLKNEFFTVLNLFGNYRKNLCKINFLSHLAVLVSTLIKDKRAFLINSDASPGMNAYILVPFLNFCYRRIFLNIILSITLLNLFYNT
jgi:hypothetical protein